MQKFDDPQLKISVIYINSCKQPLHLTATACNTSRVDNNNILVHQYTENMLLNIGVIFFIH